MLGFAEETSRANTLCQLAKEFHADGFAVAVPESRQGGNLPFYRRLPFMRGQGFTPRNQMTYNEVNLDQLSASFKTGTEVTPEALEKAHLLRDPRNPVVILGRGEMSVGLKVKAHRVSAGAKAKIEKAGGSVELIS